MPDHEQQPAPDGPTAAPFDAASELLAGGRGDADDSAAGDPTR